MTVGVCVCRLCIRMMYCIICIYRRFVWAVIADCRWMHIQLVVHISTIFCSERSFSLPSKQTPFTGLRFHLHFYDGTNCRIVSQILSQKATFFRLRDAFEHSIGALKMLFEHHIIILLSFRQDILTFSSFSNKLEDFVWILILSFP